MSTADQVFQYLDRENYRPTKTDENVVQFKIEGGTFFVLLDPNDPTFFRLVFPNFFPINNEADRQRALRVADIATARCKAGKVFLNENNVWATVEQFYASPEQFFAVFQRSLSALRFTVAVFAEEINKPAGAGVPVAQPAGTPPRPS
jgi:hypothetical protein